MRSVSVALVFMLAASPVSADVPPSLATDGLDKSCWATLREGLHSADYDVRLSTVQALGDLAADGIDVTAWLRTALGDPEHDVRVAAVDALSRARSPSAVVLLRTVVADKTEKLEVRVFAASALLRRAPRPN